MSYDYCPRCGSYDCTDVRHTGYGSTVYQCEDCGYEFEIDDDEYGNNSSWGWQTAVDED